MKRARAGLAGVILLIASLGAAACTEAIARSEPAPQAGGAAAPSIEQLAEAMAAWQENAVSVQMTVRLVVTDAAGEAVIDLEQRVLLDLRTWEMYTVTGSGHAPGPEVEVNYHLLLRGDGTYMTPALEEGWLQIGEGIDLGTLVESMQSSGFDADLLTDPRLDVEFGRGTLEGREVWVVRTSISPDLLDDPRIRQVAGDALGDFWDGEEVVAGINQFAGDLVSVQYVDPLTGAPLRSETTMLAVDGGGGLLRVTVTADTIGWNAPFELPQPEPLLEGDEAEAVSDDWYKQEEDGTWVES